MERIFWLVDREDSPICVEDHVTRLVAGGPGQSGGWIFPDLDPSPEILDQINNMMDNVVNKKDPVEIKTAMLAANLVSELEPRSELPTWRRVAVWDRENYAHDLSEFEPYRIYEHAGGVEWLDNGEENAIRVAVKPLVVRWLGIWENRRYCRYGEVYEIVSIDRHICRELKYLLVRTSQDTNLLPLGSILSANEVSKF